MPRIDREKNIIETASAILGGDPRRLTRCFESDAEVISFDGRQFLFSIDEFSREDMFRDDDPYRLGWNLAGAAISDILATAGTPLFFGHAMAPEKNWDRAFIAEFCKGVDAVLKKTGTGFIGGDTAKAEKWHYTAVVIGKTPERPLSRKGASAGESIYISGRIGRGNLEAALTLYHPGPIPVRSSRILEKGIVLRCEESACLAGCASCCIDTSDGVFNALNTLSEINNTGYRVADLPYITAGTEAGTGLDLPEELLFLGEAGEYELLFTVAGEKESGFLEQAKKKGLTFYKIGRICEAGHKVLATSRPVDLAGLQARARDFDSPGEYIKHLTGYLKEHV